MEADKYSIRVVPYHIVRDSNYKSFLAGLKQLVKNLDPICYIPGSFIMWSCTATEELQYQVTLAVVKLKYFLCL